MSDAGREAPLRVTSDDLYTEGVEEWLRREEAVHPSPEAVAPAPPGPYDFLLNSVVYTSLAGMLGGFLGWCMLEPFFDDEDTSAMRMVAGLLLFPTIGMMIGGTIASAEGLVTRNWGRAARLGFVTVAITFGLALAGAIVAGFLYSLGQVVNMSMFSIDPEHPEVRGGAFLGQMVARGLAWAVVGLAVGVSQGLAAKSKKVLANGLVGGLVGGLLGGMLFDPVDRLLKGEHWMEPGTRGAEASRCVGFTVVGLGVGFFLGLVENLAKDAWLYMKAGPLRGKQFILYHDPTVVGSSPKCHVYLFKDPAVEPKHAHIVSHGNRHQVKDLGTPAGIAVNGRKVKAHVLSSGDQIRIGDTVLEYGQKIRA